MIRTGNRVGTLTALLSAIGVAIGYLQGINWQFSAIDWQLVLPWLSAIGVTQFFTGKSAQETAEGSILGGSIATTEPSSRPDFTPLNPELIAPRQINYFVDAELECKGITCNCQFPGMDPQVMEMANAARQALGKLIVNSGYRCPIHNSDVGGASNSYHMLGRALDLRSGETPPLKPRYIYNWFDVHYPNTGGLMLYNNFIHVDSRLTKYRSDETINILL